MKIEPGKEYDGQIIKQDEFDPHRQGKYLVHINDLYPTLPDNEPSDTHAIWCRNHVHKWRITPSAHGEYGQYFPLQPGTRVVVVFKNRKMTSGYIDRIRSDFLHDTDMEAQDCTTVKEEMKDRDEQYILVKTPKKNNVFYINEDTANEPNTIFLIYNRDASGRRTVYRINEEGIHIYSRDNLRVRITKDWQVEINGKVDISVSGDVNIKSNSTINIDGGPVINLNCRNAAYTNVEDLETGATIKPNVGGDRTFTLDNFEPDTVETFEL